MKKLLRVSLMMLFALVSTSAMGQTVFDFDADGQTMFGLPGESCAANAAQGIEASDAGDITSDVSATKGDFTLTVSAGVPDPESGKVKYPNRIWNSSPKLRMYTGTLTIASSGAAIKNVVFTLHNQASKAKWGAENTANTGTLDTSAGTSVTWTGNTKNLVITIAANTQISKITINGGTPTPPTIEEINVAKALEIAGALDNKAVTENEYIVKGYIVSEPDWKPYYKVKDDPTSEILNYNLQFIMADEAGATDGLTVYQPWDTNNQKFVTIESAIAKGGFVSLQGKLTNYNGTLELTKGHFLSYNATNISNISLDNDANAPAYSLDGRRVDQNYRGVVIKGGKKMIQK